MADKMMRMAGRSEDGTAKAIKTDSDGRVEVVRGSERNFYGGGSETLAQGESFLVYENAVPSRLDFFEFSSNNTRTQVEIRYKKGSNYWPIGHIMKNGSNVAGHYVAQIVSDGASIWDIMSYEEGAYKFSLNRSFDFSEGFRIEIFNTGPDDINVAGRVFGVESIV